MARQDLWTREQTIVAFNLYCSIPFGQAHSRNAKVIETAKIVGRTPGAVARKLGNFGSLDPELRARGIVGLGNRSKLDEIIWDEFNADWNKLAFESTELIAEFKKQPIEEVVRIDIAEFPKGKDVMRFVKTRIYQDFFRSSVMAAYENVCCITGIAMPELHTASHIKPWRIDEDNRTNPQNGLCLNALHDRAFDKGLITILPDLTISVSKHLEEIESKEAIQKYFLAYDKQSIIKPHKFLPEKHFLEYHNDTIFRK